MPLNPSIFSQVDTNAGDKLADLVNPYRIEEQRNGLADLAVQRQTRKMALTEAQQSQRDRAELKMALGHSGGDWEKMHQVAVQSNTPEGLAFAAKIEPQLKLMREAKAQERFGGAVRAYGQPVDGLPATPESLRMQEQEMLAQNPTQGAAVLGALRGKPNMQMIETAQGQQAVDLNDPNAPKSWGAKPRQDNTLVAVIGADGQTPVLVPRAQAAGMTPVTSKAGAGASAKMNPQQLEQAALSAQQAIDQAAKIFAHPGKGMGTGMTSQMGRIPGTDAYGFQANLETFKAQTFIPLVQALKGMGALSDAEGKKLADSVGALQPGMKDTEFESNLIEATQFLFNKAKAAGLNVTLPPFAAVSSGGASGSWGIERVK